MGQAIEQLEPAFMDAVRAALQEYFADDADGKLSREELTSQIRDADCLGDIRNALGELWQHGPSDRVLNAWNDLQPFMTDEHWSTAQQLAVDILDES